ncbi:MAG: type II toxin-antitoxin system RelE/ParE family toxin [Devosia sp.]|nr:type II toxin-antitoxin system RelE/ParE family toxin [Devosia sp.]
MRLRWSDDALAHLERLYDFLEPKSSRSAAHSVARLRERALRLVEQPRIGERPAVPGREFRRLIVGDYELRYEVREQEVLVLRIWHAREDR